MKLIEWAAVLLTLFILGLFYNNFDTVSVRYDIHGKTVSCMYNFIVVKEDKVIYFSQHIDGIGRYISKDDKGHEHWAVDFSKTIEHLGGIIDPNLNEGFQEDATDCDVKS